MRDIYITPATLDDWRAIYPLLRDFEDVEFSVDGAFQPPPATVEQAFAIPRNTSPILGIPVGRAFVLFHFFSEEEIECDFVPNDLSSQTDLDALLEFLRQLGDTTHKRVVITPENLPDRPFISYDPRTRKFEYHEAAE